jgi:hypothetical protein
MNMETHLTEEESASYVDALVLDKQAQLPEEIREHVAECFECKAEVMDVWELIEAIRQHSPLDSPPKQ